MSEKWHIVIGIAWGPGAALTDNHYMGEHSLKVLPLLIRDAYEATRRHIPSSEKIHGVRYVKLYADLESLCDEYNELDVCEQLEEEEE